MTEKARIFTVAEVPRDLEQQWLQHLRDFDTAHPDCHFQVMVDAPPSRSLAEMIQMIQLEPGLDFQQIFERK